MTRDLIAARHPRWVKVLDHLVVAGDDHYSFADTGLLDELGLTVDEKSEVVANCDDLKKLRFSPVLPYAFTEHGAIMAATVLNSPRAIQVSIYVVEAFVRLRELLTLNRDLAQKFAELDRRIVTHDAQIQAILEAIRQLMTPPEQPRKDIGFHVKEDAVPCRIKGPPMTPQERQEIIRRLEVGEELSPEKGQPMSR